MKRKRITAIIHHLLLYDRMQNQIRMTMNLSCWLWVRWHNIYWIDRSRYHHHKDDYEVFRIVPRAVRDVLIKEDKHSALQTSPPHKSHSYCHHCQIKIGWFRKYACFVRFGKSTLWRIFMVDGRRLYRSFDDDGDVVDHDDDNDDISYLVELI